MIWAKLISESEVKLTSLLQSYINTGLALTPPMGWNRWNSFRMAPSESLIKEMVDAMVESGMKDAGKLSFEEEKSHFSMWCILASPIIARNNLRNMSENTRAILNNKEAIAINQDPYGEQGVLINDIGGLQIYSKVLGSATAGERAVALFNRRDLACKMTVTDKMLGLSGEFSVRDVWDQEDRGSFRMYTVEVPAHGVVLIKIDGNSGNLS